MGSWSLEYRKVVRGVKIHKGSSQYDWRSRKSEKRKIGERPRLVTSPLTFTG